MNSTNSDLRFPLATIFRVVFVPRQSWMWFHYVRLSNAASLFIGPVELQWRLPWLPHAAAAKGWDECFRETGDAQAWRLIANAKEATYVAMEAELAYTKGELAYMKLQRDALLEMTWLDLPDEPHESTAQWRAQFNEGWVRRACGGSAICGASVTEVR